MPLQGTLEKRLLANLEGLHFYKYIKLNAQNFFAKFHTVRKNEVIERAKCRERKKKTHVFLLHSPFISFP